MTKWILDVANVKSGTKKERRILKNSWREFHEVDYTSFAEKEGLPVRCFSTLRGWLNELNVKKGKFDRYSCGVCFEGRLAEERIRVGKGKEGDREIVEKWQDHQLLFRHQFEAAQSDKEVKSPEYLFMIYDYSTIHDFTKEKVSFSFFFFFFFLFSSFPFFQERETLK